MPVDYGFFANATSLNTQAQKIFSELGLLMNEKKSFTIAATMLNDSAIGDVNQHYDILHVPNMGGYKFPLDSVLKSQQLVISMVGIDEVILGREVFRSESMWKRNKPIIENELKKWKNKVDDIKLIHVNTESEKEEMNQYLKIPKEKMVVIPLGVDHDIFSPSKNKIETRKMILKKHKISDGPYFVHVSERNWARKNLFRLLESFKKSKQQGIVQKLIILGKNDPMVYEKTKDMSDVHVLGFVASEDLVKFMQGSDALLLPSLHEGWGMPLVESMACGVPVITSKKFSMPDVVGGAGLFVDPYDVKDIESKILELSKSESLRENLGKKGIQKAKEYTWRKTAEAIFEQYSKLTDVKNIDFEHDYEIAAKRTIVTMCRISHDYDELKQDMLEFNYEKLSHHVLDTKSNNSVLPDLLLPFRHWIEQNLVDLK